MIICISGNMADSALPTEYDAIVLGTGLPEAVAAAALSRIGYKVLHLDRNDYYSGYWASFSFDHLQEWIKRNSSQEVDRLKTCAERGADGDADGETLKLHEKRLSVPVHGSAISNLQVQSFFSKTNLDKKNEADCKEIIDKEDEGKKDIVCADLKENEENAGSVNPADGTCSESLPELEVSDSAAVKKTEQDIKVGQLSSEQLSDGSDPTNAKQDDTERSFNTPSVLTWAERRKMKKELKLGRDATYEQLSEQSRKFNLDLAPKLLFSRGSLVESLISANISHYAEFKIVSRILTYMNGRIEEVPCSRSDVFNSELINVLEKRALMRFITFCVNFEESPEQYLDFKDKPFIEFLKSRKLTPNVQRIITHAIAVVQETTPTLCGLKATQKFLRSLGRYGNTPFLWSLYGSGEIPQAFCRMCAVFGGIYCLRKNVNCLVFDEQSNKCVGVTTEDGQRLSTKWLIMEKSYAPEPLELESKCMISRAILITDKSLKPSSREHLSLLTLPNKSGGIAVRVIELGPSSMACPKSLYVVHLISEASSTAFEDLQGYVKELFTAADKDENDCEKPAVLWAVYFNRKCFGVTDSQKIPENVKLTSLPSTQLDFESAMNEAKEIFLSICPNEEFLPAVPNPEDIIWDDVLTNVTGEQSVTTSEDNTEEPSGDQDGSEIPSVENSANGSGSCPVEQGNETAPSDNVAPVKAEVTVAKLEEDD